MCLHFQNVVLFRNRLFILRMWHFSGKIEAVISDFLWHTVISSFLWHTVIYKFPGAHGHSEHTSFDASSCNPNGNHWLPWAVLKVCYPRRKQRANFSIAPLPLSPTIRAGGCGIFVMTETVGFSIHFHFQNLPIGDTCHAVSEYFHMLWWWGRVGVGQSKS